MQNRFILKMFDDGITLEKISLAFNKTIHEIINIVYDLKINKK